MAENLDKLNKQLETTIALLNKYKQEISGLSKITDANYLTHLIQSFNTLNDIVSKRSQYTKYRENLQNTIKVYQELKAQADKLDKSLTSIGDDKYKQRLKSINSAIANSIKNSDYSRAAALVNEYARTIEKANNKIIGQKRAEQTAIKQVEQANKLKAQSEKEAAAEASRAAKERETAERQVRDSINKTIDTIRSVSKSVNDVVNGIIGATRSALQIVGKVINSVFGIIKTAGSSIRSALQIIGKVINSVFGIIKTAGSSIKFIMELLSNFGNRLKDILEFGVKGFLLVNVFTALKSAVSLVTTSINKLNSAFNALFNNEYVQKSNKLLGSIYSMNTIMGGELSQNTIDWANKMEKAFGINASQLISDLGEINGVLYGLGMAADDVSIGSKNLLLMSRYLASVGAAGGNANTVMDKLVSGMKGMTASVDDLGLSVRESQMDTFIDKLKASDEKFRGLGNSFAYMTEQQRVYIRYAALMDQFTSKYDITNIVNGMNTVTGRLGIIKDTWSEFLTQIGTGLSVMLARLSAVFIKVIQWMKSIAGAFFGLFNIDINLGTGLNDQVTSTTSGVSGLNDELDNTSKKLDNIKESADSAKGSLQSFDRVNNVTSSSSSGSGSSTDLGIDNSIFDDLMHDMLADLDKLADEAEESFTDKIWGEFVDKAKQKYNEFIEFAKDKTGRADFNLGFNFKAIQLNIYKIIDNIKRIISSAGDLVITIGLKFLDDINIGKLITDLSFVIEAFTNLAAVIVEVLNPALNAFYDIGLSPIVKYLGEVLHNALVVVYDEFNNWAKWFKDNEDTILRFFESLGRVVAYAFELIKPYLDELFGSISEWFKGINENGRNGLLSFMTGFIEDEEKTKEYLGVAIPELIENIKTVLESLKGIAESLLYIIGQLLDKFGEFLVNEGLPWLLNKLKELDAWIRDNKDAIVDILTKVAGLAWDGFKLFVDLVGKLIDFVVKHPNSVVLFLSSIITIKPVLESLKGIADSLLDIIGQLLDKFGEFLVDEGLPWLLDKLKELDDWLKDNKDKIVDLLTKIAGLAWDGFKIFVDLVGKLIDFVVKHPNSVAIFLGNLLAIKAASWFTNTALGILKFVSALKGMQGLGGVFTSLFGGAGAAGATGAGAAGTSLLPATGATGASTAVAGILPATGVFAGLAGSIVGVVEGVKSIVDESYGAEKAIKQLLDTNKKVIVNFLDVEQQAIGVTSRIKETFGNTIDETTLLNILDNIRDKYLETGQYTVDQLISIMQTYEEEIRQSGIVIVDEQNNTVDKMITKSNEYTNNLTGLYNNTINNVEETNKQLSDSIQKSELAVVDSSNQMADSVSSNTETVKKKSDEIIDKTNEIKNSYDGVNDSITKTSENNGFTTILNESDNILNKTVELKSGFDGVNTSVTNIGNNNAFANLKTKLSDIKDGLNGIVDKFKEWAGLKPPEVKTTNPNILGNINGFVSNASSRITSQTKATSAMSITAHAKGGSIAGGQLFIANEGGSAELIGNIDGTGKTNVANNEMITRAIYEAVYNAMADIQSQTTLNNTAPKSTNINLNGFGIIDRNTVYQLAKMLAPYMNASNINIANTGFSI